jgi:hypothetical protein
MDVRTQALVCRMVARISDHLVRQYDPPTPAAYGKADDGEVNQMKKVDTKKQDHSFIGGLVKERD